MPTAEHRESEIRGFRDLLVADHLRLDALFDDLVNASEAGGARDLIGTLWTRFENAVFAHFEAEEKHLFPALGATHPTEVELLRTQHEQLRKRLLELDVEVDLHLIRHPTVLSIVRELREHASLEERTVYPWADREIPQEERSDLLSIIHRRLVGSHSSVPR